MLTQIQLINYLLSTKDYSIVIDNNLNADYFPSLHSEFNFIASHYKEYNQVPDVATFVKTFPDFDIIEVGESKEYLLSQLYKEKNEDFLAKTFNKVRELLMAGKSEEATNYFSAAANSISDIKHLDAVNILSDISRYDLYVDKCNDFHSHYVSTGFKELDDSLGGGIDRKNSYFVISARPGVGKTLVMVKFATAAVKAGLTVGMYEGEMSVDKVAGRYDTMISHISNGAITHGNTMVANQYKAYLDELKSSNSGKFYVLTRDMVSDDKITVDVLSNFIDKYNLDILFVDQMSLLDSRHTNMKYFEQMSEISKGIKNLQVRKGIPIVVASQQNRDAMQDGKVVGVENLANSDRIGQDATEVISLSKSNDLMTINIIKARDGAKVYKLKYAVDFDKGNFDFIKSAEDDDSEEDYSSGEKVFE